MLSATINPSATGQLYTGGAAGADVIAAGPCAGTVSGLAVPVARGPSTAADGAGAFVLTPTLPVAGCGLPAQVLDESTCTFTNVANLPSQNWFRVGSYNVGDGLAWGGAPPTYSCQEACSEIFGAPAAEYYCSTATKKLPRDAKNTGYAIGGCGVNSDTFKVGVTYVPGSYSAYTQDNCTSNDKNYCWHQ